MSCNLCSEDAVSSISWATEVYEEELVEDEQ
jgi:hypothetical protein